MWKLRGYVVERRLGAGGTGEVWRGRVAATGEPVALKRLPLPDAARARAEAAKLAALDHPHLVRLHALVPERDTSVLVLDLAEGGSLADLLAARGRLTPGEVITAVAPVAAAVAYLHTAGIVHGDVTPANVLFTPGGIPLLADLGVARLTGDDADAESTPAYVDPRVADGCVPGATSDVFMLAAVALHALTGAPPWPGSPDEALAAARVERIGDVTTRLTAAGVEPEMAAVVLRALDMEPSLRGSAADFALELRHSGRPVAVELAAGRLARIPDRSTRTWSWDDAAGSGVSRSVAAGSASAGSASAGSASAGSASAGSASAGSVPAGGAGGSAAASGGAAAGSSGSRDGRVRDPRRGALDGTARRRDGQRDGRTPAATGVTGATETAASVWTGPRHAAVPVAAPPTRSLGPRPRPSVPRVRAHRLPAPSLRVRRSGDPAPHLRRRVVLTAVLAAAAVVLAAAVTAAVRAGTPAPRATAHRSAAAARAPSPSTSPSTPRPDPWAARLLALDGMRSRAFAARQPALLRHVYVPGPLLAADTALLLRLVPPGCGLVGVRTVYRGVRARAAGDTTVDLTVVASLPASDLVCAGRPTRRAAPTGPVGLRLRLHLDSAGWRIAEQAPA